MTRAVAIVFFLFVTNVVEALEAGAAKVEITPPLGTPLNGYFDRLGRGAVRVHDPLWARCLYLSDSETSLFLVSADLCMINRELRDRVLELAPPAVSSNHIMLAATHTHNAQGGMARSLAFRTVSGRFMPEVLEQTAARIAEAMQAAYAARKRAVIGYTTLNQPGLSVNRAQPDGAVDQQVGVVRVEDADGNAIAIVANFAAHPTTVPEADLYAISADYPGVFCDELERQVGGGCTALFTNGADGDQRCGNPDGRTGWERTASIGRLLAASVKDAAAGITCAEHTLHVSYSEPVLPPTLARSFLPAKTILQTLEIGDLLLAFVPGEFCVGVGLELRRRALARGYAAQYTIGLANDYLLYFVPRTEYSRVAYESRMSLYGPGAEDWVYREFSNLMTRGNPDPPTEAAAPPAALHALADTQRVVLTGTPYQMGFQRAGAFKESINRAYRARVLARVDAGIAVPDVPLLQWTPPFIDPAPFLLPWLAITARPMLTGLPASVFEEIEGMAAAAGLPFDAVWLLHCFAVLPALRSGLELYSSPVSTMFAVVGDRAGADQLLVGCNLSWPREERLMVIESRPKTGRHFVQVGYDWNAGAMIGMNDAGIVVCAERADAQDEPSLLGPPVELMLRSVLEVSGSFSQALELLRAQTYVRGWHMLVAHPSPPNARVLEFGIAIQERESVNGLLWGTDPDSTCADEAARTRYGRVAQSVGQERIIAAPEIERALRAGELPGIGQAGISKNMACSSIVFEPNERRLRIAFANADGILEESVPVYLGENAK
jgi:hypothetical protein